MTPGFEHAIRARALSLAVTFRLKTRAELAERYRLPAKVVQGWEEPGATLDPIEIELLKAIAANMEQVAIAQRD